MLETENVPNSSMYFVLTSEIRWSSLTKRLNNCQFTKYEKEQNEWISVKFINSNVTG